MTGSDAAAREQAIDWAVRAGDPAFDDWEALTDWLSADPRHAMLYDRITVAVDDAGAVLRKADKRPLSMPARRFRPSPWLRYAVAAMLVATVGVGGWRYREAQQPSLYRIDTPAGAPRTVTLAGSVRIDLNGETSVTLDRRDSRFASLDRGEAVFTVAHDAAHPFRVRSGGATVTDLGTVFGVALAGTETRVSVEEGEVRVATQAGSTDVPAGRAVSVSGDVIVPGDASDQAIGDWRRGRIDFAGVSLAELATRVRRATGARIDVAPEIASRRVSGSVAIGGDPAATFRTLAGLLDIDIARHDNRWTWRKRNSPPPS